MKRCIKNASKLERTFDCFIKEGYPFRVWMDFEHVNDEWTNLLQKYNLKEAERNVMMKRENTLHIGKEISNQLTIIQVKNKEELLKYMDVFISLFEGTAEQVALQSYFNKF